MTMGESKWKRLLLPCCVFLFTLSINEVYAVRECGDRYTAKDSANEDPFVCAKKRRTSRDNKILDHYRTNGIEHFCIIVNEETPDQYGGVQAEDNFNILSYLVKNKAWSYQINDNFPRSGKLLGFSQPQANPRAPKCLDDNIPVGCTPHKCKDDTGTDPKGCKPACVNQAEANGGTDKENCLGIAVCRPHEEAGEEGKDPPGCRDFCNSTAPDIPAGCMPPFNSFMQRPPMDEASNPYFVEVNGISLKGELLHNWLHFRVYMNRSTRDTDQKRLHSNNDPKDNAQNRERRDNARGIITAMVMMVKDQDGWPVGDFSQELPCNRSCTKYVSDVYQGNKRNALPCAFTPPGATSHPGMFLFDIDPGNYPVNVTENSTARREGVREVHATWHFNQDSCNFVTELHIQTLIFEDLKPIKAEKQNSERVYGWSAQYNILYPKGKSSLGAADYVNIEYWKDRDQRFPEIDCHVPLFDAAKVAPSSFTKGPVPATINEGTSDVILPVPSISAYLFSIAKVIGVENEYYGQHSRESDKCRGIYVSLQNSEETAAQNLKELTTRTGKAGIPSVTEFLKAHSGIQCPCPALPSTEPIEQRTPDPSRLHGRLMHASHMTLVYMLLTPLACFVARYYKETFVTVFCFQEYWWFMWHVVLLIGAAGFIAGAILSITLRKEVELEYSANLWVHVVLGCVSIVIFFIEIFTGFFRHSDPMKRMRQIFMHWLVGVLNNVCAIGSMFAMAWQNESGMSCRTVYTIVGWLLFVILWYVIMELDMRRTDKKMELKPPRTYLPPPVMRLFTRDAPGRAFRMIMLGLFILILIAIQFFVSYYIWNSGGSSCYEEWVTDDTTVEIADESEEAEEYDDY